ncbi:MAG: DJ-1/PfpI family protein [Bacteroidota bacterium]
MEKREPIRVFFIVPPKVHLLDISGPIHVFYEAIECGAHIDSKFLSINNHAEQLSSAGLFFSRLENYDDYILSEFDIILIPGLDANLISDNRFEEEIQPFLSWLKTQAQNGAKICSVCTGAYLLGFSGLLNEKEMAVFLLQSDCPRSG